MSVKYSESRHSCYDTNLSYGNLPEDLVPITKEEYNKYWVGKPPQGFVLKRNKYPFQFIPCVAEVNIKEEALTTVTTTINKPLFLDGVEVSCKDNAKHLRDCITELTFLGTDEDSLILYYEGFDKVVTTTLSKLKDTYKVFINRKQSILKSYKGWLDGDMSTPFTIEAGVTI